MSEEEQHETVGGVSAVSVDSDAPASGGVNSVEIHKPKAAHSWREFLTEIGTIVCGILIALGLEQVVEAARLRQEVHEARETIRGEIADNAQSLLFGMAEDKCFMPQIEAFGVWARGGPKPPSLRTNLAEYQSTGWDSVKAGAVTHMPLEERLAIAGFYAGLTNQNKVVEEQRASALVLFGAQERDRLEGADASRVLDAVAVARQITGFHTGNAEWLLDKVRDLGIKTPPLTSRQRQRIAELCGAVSTSPSG